VAAPVPALHLLATEGQVHIQRDHVWHMEKLAEVCKASDGLLLGTPCRQVDVADTASAEENHSVVGGVDRSRR
jgi:hypothetical protein